MFTVFVSGGVDEGVGESVGVDSWVIIWKRVRLLAEGEGCEVGVEGMVGFGGGVIKKPCLIMAEIWFDLRRESAVAAMLEE